MRPTATYFLKNIATECTDPSRAELQMKTTLKQLLRRNKSLQRRNFLEKITKKGIGTNKAESAARTLAKDCSVKGDLTKEHLRKSFLNSIMKVKLEDANREFKVEDFKFHKEKKSVAKVINDGDILERVRNFTNKEAEHEWSKNKDKLEKKIKHLERKYTPKETIKHNIRDIKVSDEALGARRPISEPIIYNIAKETVPENVKKVLQLHPKFAVAKPINMMEVKTEIQRGFYKQRLNMKNEEERKLVDESEEEFENNEIKSHALVDDETKVMNFNNLRPTDLPTNKQVFIPPLASNRVEIQMAAIEAELVQATNDYLRNNCDRKGIPNESNLSSDTAKGIKQTIEMTKNDGVIVTETDKSSKLCLDTIPEYVAMAEPHIRNDKVVSDEKVAAIEKLMNAHSYQLCRIFGVCTAWDSGTRVKSAMTNKSLPPPTLRVSHKDHKVRKPGEPAPSRPICNASVSPNGQTSHLVSMILNHLADSYDDGTECKSTEEMIAGMEEKVNNRDDIEEMIIGSMDVKSLYPSLLANQSTKIVTEVFMETDLIIEGVDWSETGKYLAINLSKDEINELGLQELVSTRAKKGGRSPGMTTAEIMGKLHREDEEEVQSLFNPPKMLPTAREKKILLAQVLKTAMLAVLQNHTYQFENGQIRLQNDGSPIGLEMAGALARVVMIWWDKRFLSLVNLNLADCYLYLRYIDDQNMAMRPLAPGTRWQIGPWADGLGGKMVVIEQLVQSDELLPADMRTMEELRKMGNSICEIIQLEEDFPSKHDDQKLPILDLKVNVEKVQINGEPRSKLFYRYYRKPMSNWQLIPAESALSASVKRTSLTQYGLRILRNTKLEVPWSEKAEMLSEFSARLRDSGYTERYRQQLIESVLRGWDKMLIEHEAGRRPINRARNWQEETRKKQKVKKKTGWFKTGGFSTVIFCPFTPGSELAKKWRAIEAKDAETRGWRYKVVEQSGRQVRSIVCKNPWSGPCNDPICMICSTGGSGNCRKPGCTYKVQCMRCKEHGPDAVPVDEGGGNRPGQGKVGKPCTSLYHGESGYSGYIRGKDHKRDMQTNKQTNAMVRHNILYHLSQQVDYQMSVVSTHREPLGRQLREGVEIVGGQQDILLNSKEEFLQGAVPSSRTQRGFGQ